MTNQVLHMFDLVSRGHTGICNLHALSSEKEKNSKLLAKPFCRRHASSIPARSTQEEKPDQLDQEKVHRWESSRKTKCYSTRQPNTLYFVTFQKETMLL